MGTNKLAVLRLQIDAAAGGCGFSIKLSNVGTEIDVKNISPEDMVRQLRQLAIGFPLYLERIAADLEAKNASGQINAQVH